jgi:putative membrane protein, TIGR04086 family/integral membrane protein, TIGR04097 family
MQEISKLGKNLLTSFIILIIGIIIITLLSYFNIINDKILVVFKVIVSFLAITVGSFKQGNQSNKRGFLEGLKIGTIFSIIYVLLNYLFFKHFAIKNLLYYFLILFISIASGMFGISKKNDKEKK